MTLLKITLFCVFMCLRGLRFKVPHTVHYCCSSKPRLSETKLIVLRSEVCSDWPAIQCAVIGRIPQACDGNVTPITIFGISVSIAAATILKRE